MKIEEAIIRARRSGLSVVEIARVMCWKANSVHDFLVKQSEITPLPRRHKPVDVSEVHGAIIEGLKEQNLSLERWAHGRGRTLDEAILYLSKPMDTDNDDSKYLHMSLCTDFIKHYKDAFGVEVCERVVVKSSVEHYSVEIQWERKRSLYVARFPEMGENGPTGAGCSRVEAMEQAEKALSHHNRLAALEEAILVRADLDSKYGLDWL